MNNINVICLQLMGNSSNSSCWIIHYKSKQVNLWITSTTWIIRGFLKWGVFCTKKQQHLHNVILI